MFEVQNQGIGTFSSRVTLEPPHYDGVQSLALRDNVLFSGSRDYVIKKWDLESKELLTVRIGNYFQKTMKFVSKHFIHFYILAYIFYFLVRK